MKPLTIPRSIAIRLARIERDSLRARARSAPPARRGAWAQAARQADRVLSLLHAEKDTEAAMAAIKIGPYWKSAAKLQGYLGADEDVPAAAEPFDLEAAVKAHGEALERLNVTAESELFFRKVATFAAVAGALFAAVRLTDIWLAVKRRKAQE